jgi:hypothetical protein
MTSENTKRSKSMCLGVLSMILGVVSVAIPVVYDVIAPENQFPNIYGILIILSWFAAIAIGISAIIIGRSVKFKRGVIGGYIGVGFSAFFFLSSLFLYVCTISDGRFHCQHEIQYLSSAIQQYCKQNEGYFPDEEAWCDQLLKIVEYKDYYSNPSRNDVTIGPNGEISDFAFNKNLDGYRLADFDHKTVLLFETERGWNQNGISDILLPEGHPGYYVFIEGGYHFVFVGPDSTLTVEFVKNSKIDRLNWVK